MITAIFGSLIIGILVGALFTAVTVRSDSYPCNHWDYDMKAGEVSELRTEKFFLENELRRLRYMVDNYQLSKRHFDEIYAAHCHYCSKNFYSKDHKGQEVADLLKKQTLNVEELAKKLDINIK